MAIVPQTFSPQHAMDTLGYIYQRTIHLRDTDAAGVVYFANILHLCHEAYEACLTEQGFMWQALLEQGDLAIPIVHGEISCLKPIHWGDRLSINLFPVAHPKKLGQFTVQYQLLDQGSTLMAIGSTKHIVISIGDRQRQPFPAILEKWLQNAPKCPEPKT